MSYITKADILTRIELRKLVQLTDDAGTGTVNEDVVASIIAEAEGTIDAYARVRYSLPLTVTPKVRSTCLDIADFRLHARRATTTEGIFGLKEKAYDKAIQFWKDVSTGKAALDVAAAEESQTNPTSGDAVLKGSSRSVFTDDKLSSF